MPLLSIKAIPFDLYGCKSFFPVLAMIFFKKQATETMGSGILGFYGLSLVDLCPGICSLVDKGHGANL